MGKVQLLSGSYSARSVIANAQRCVNLYPETNPPETEAPVPVTHYLTPGLTRLATPAVANWRCLYRASTTYLFGVVGNSVYYIDPAWNATFLGLIAAGTNNVSISDNGIVCVLVDGTGAGYWWGATPAGVFHTIADAAFYGANRVCFLDGRFIFNRPGTNQFYLSPSYWDGITAFDPTYIASKVGGPDQILSLSVIRGELWLIGNLTTEVWFNAGGVDFPFERQPGVFIDHGLAFNGYTVSETDVEVFWLGSDRQGQLVVFMGQEYQAKRISNHALETALQGYSPSNGFADATGFVYQQGGHTFYVLTFPTWDKTWVYDLSTSQWHERVSFDGGGAEHRWRPSCFAFAYNLTLAGDYTNGKLYLVDPTVQNEDGQVIWRRRGFPHLRNDSRRVSYSSFVADMEVGAAGDTDFVFLRWSDTAGKTWGTPISISMGGLTDNNLRSLIFRRLGMARDRVFELYWFFPSATALNSAAVETERAET